MYLHALHVSNDTDRHYEWAVAMADSNSGARAFPLLLAELTPSIIDCIRDFIRSDTAGAGTIDGRDALDPHCSLGFVLFITQDLMQTGSVFFHYGVLIYNS